MLRIDLESSNEAVVASDMLNKQEGHASKAEAAPLSQFLTRLRKEKSLSAIVCDDARISWLPENSLMVRSVSSRWASDSPPSALHKSHRGESFKTVPLPPPPPPGNLSQRQRNISSPGMRPARKRMSRRNNPVQESHNHGAEQPKHNFDWNDDLATIMPRRQRRMPRRQISASRWDDFGDKAKLTKQDALPLNISRKLSPTQDEDKPTYRRKTLPASLRALPSASWH